MGLVVRLFFFSCLSRFACARAAAPQAPDRSSLWNLLTLRVSSRAVRTWPQYGMDRRTLRFHRHNITVVHDDDRPEAMRFLNINNPIFAR